MDKINPIKPNQIPGVGKIKPSPAQKVSPQGASFKEILESKLNNEVKFSGHALQRIQRREIFLDDVKLNKLKDAMVKADEKGARSSLVLMDDLALIVSIKNRTVITAIDGSHIKENVFTNIDSAVIM